MPPNTEKYLPFGNGILKPETIPHMKHTTLLISAIAVLATITSCTLIDFGGKKDSDKVEVTGVTLSKTELTIEKGDSETITATVSPSNATDKTVTWTSSNSAVAEVDANGVITANDEGEATITASCSSKTASCKVTVVKPTMVVTGDASSITWDSAVLAFKVRIDMAGTYTSFNAGVTMSNTDAELIPGGTEFMDMEIYKDKDGNPDVSGEYLLSTSALEANTTYYYRAWADFDGQITYGEKKSFKTPELNIETSQAVDLGLSVKWAGYNVGAEKPEDTGDYFAWGETKSKDTFTYGNYAFGTKDDLMKYCNNSKFGHVDGRRLLMACDDAANVNWGDNWRMPTSDEKRELLQHTTQTPYTLNGVAGYIFTSTVNGKSIFIPSAGVKGGSEILKFGEECTFWTSEMRDSDNNYAYVTTNIITDSGILTNAGFEMDALTSSFNLNSLRFGGRPVRAVLGSAIAEEPYAVITSEASEITALSAKVSMEIKPSATASDKGILYGVYSEDNTDEPLPGIGSVASVDDSGAAILTGLAQNSLVKARAYAVIDGVTYYGNVVSFNTPILSDIAVTSEVTDITSSSVTLNGKIGDLSVYKKHYGSVEAGLRWRETYSGYDKDPWMSYATDIPLEPDASGNITASLSGLSRYTEYYVRAYVKFDGVYYYGESVTFRTLDETLADYVDLGLSVLWASKNLGAESPDQRGSSFAWGETTTKAAFSSANYKFYDSDYNVTKYNSSDNLVVLAAEDDAATAALGTGVRTPTKEEWEELMENVTATKSTHNGNYVIKLTSKKNDAYIYMTYGFSCSYWSSTVNTNYVESAYAWNFYDNTYIKRTSEYRAVGNTGDSSGNYIRPVKDK